MDPNALTREQILQVMQACDLADCSEEAIEQCVADAIAIRESQASRAPQAAAAAAAAYDDGEGAAAPAQLNSTGPAPGEQPHVWRQHTTTTQRATRAVLREDDEYDEYGYEVEASACQPPQRQPATARNRVDGISPFSNQPAPPASNSASRMKQQPHHQSHGHRHTTRSHQHRFERTSISSVRGTPVVGRPGVGTPSARAIPQQQQFVDPQSGGVRRAAASGPAAARAADPPPQKAAGLAGRRPQSASAVRRAIPGYMSSAYAEHLMSRVAGETEAEAEVREDAEAPANDGGPRHQRRFEPFVSASTRAREMREHDENHAPPTARANKAPAEAGDGKPRASHDRSSAANESVNGRGRPQSVHSSAAGMRALEANLTGVIYAPLGSKTYLAGGFRSRSQRAPVASPRLGAPRKVSDPVRRYQQMKDYWDHDHFLRMQRPDGQRRKLRWAVRTSMNEWHPESSVAVDHHNSLAY